MNRRTFIVVSLFLFLICCGASLYMLPWDVQSGEKIDASNKMDSDGLDDCQLGSSLLTAFKRILVEEYNSEIDHCTLCFVADVFLTDAFLQSEIQNQLAMAHPSEMAEALKSSGNMHNPKLSFLYSALEPAILDTHSMVCLMKVMDSYGYALPIRILGKEKLQIKKQSLHGDMFAEPECRIYGITGFSARKYGVKSKKSLTARIVCIDLNGNVISDEVKKIERNQYW